MKSKTKNTLIGGLLAIVFVMAIGYAAFAQQLTINGNAEITSKWDVHIKSITPAATGTAKSNSATVGTDKLSATFSTTLTSPGDTVTYTVVVENSGTLAAKVASGGVTFSQGNTDAITYSTSGITAGTTTVAANGGTVSFTVKVAYNSNVTSQPASSALTNALTMSLNFVQA